MPIIVTNQVGFEVIILVALFGWLVALQVNYLSDVLPITRKLSKPTCISCANEFAVIDYLLLKPCRKCGSRRSFRTWFVQIAIPVMLIAITIFPLRRLDFWIASILLAYFALVVVIDMEYRLILHPVSLVGAIGGGFLGWSLNGWEATIIGGAAGFVIMFALYYLGILFMRVVRRRNNAPGEDESALGFGDVFLSGVIGLMLGWMDIVGGLLFAIIIGGVISGLYILVTGITRRYKPLAAIPYGPFLVLGALVYLFVPSFYYL